VQADPDPVTHLLRPVVDRQAIARLQWDPPVVDPLSEFSCCWPSGIVGADAIVRPPAPIADPERSATGTAAATSAAALDPMALRLAGGSVESVVDRPGLRRPSDLVGRQTTARARSHLTHGYASVPNVP
jgi:hypothetical protein